MVKYLHRIGTETEFEQEYNGNTYENPWLSYTDESSDSDYNNPYHRPLTFFIFGDGEISWALGDKTVKYRKNFSAWANMTSATTISVKRWDRVQFKGTNASYAGCRISSTARFEASGNIMSLINESTFPTLTTIGASGFSELFMENISLLSAGRMLMPAKTLGTFCYGNMFTGCEGLRVPPKELPATTVVTSAYTDMFSGCTRLENIPIFTPQSIGSQGCRRMFVGCISLTEVPDLNFGSISSGGCYSMFYGCTSLVESPSISATTVSSNGFRAMFAHCTNLLRAGNISATSIGSSGCTAMFSGTTSLDTTLIMKVGTFSNSAATQMFVSCIGVDVILSGTSTFGNATFYNSPSLRGVSFPNSLSTIPTNSFRLCTGLTEVTFNRTGSLTLGNYLFAGTNVTKVYSPSLSAWMSIGWGSTTFFGYSAGTQYHQLFINGEELRNLVIPSSYTQIKAQQFRGCYRINSVVIPTSVTSIATCAFCRCTGLSNLEIPSTVQNMPINAIANGPGRNGTVTFPGNITSAGTSGADYNFRGTNFVVGGNLTALNPYPVVGGTYPVSCRIGGNLTLTSGYTNFSDAGSGNASNLVFLEVMGTITGKAIYNNTDGRYINNNFILHLGYSGVACTPTIAAATYARVKKIYVGDGSSAAADQAVLDMYLADSNWSASSGKSKLELWSNYHGQYRDE